MFENRFHGRVAVITGGASGAGKAVAARIVAEGGRVAIWDQDASGANAACGDTGAALAIGADVTDAESIAKATDETVAALGRIDILLNSAGVTGPTTPLTEYPVDAFHKIVDIHLNGTFHCCRSVVPQMVRNGYGRIVNVASIAGLRGYAYVTAYVAAKHALVGFTRALAMEVIQKGITVNAVCPGYTDTDLVRGAASAISAKTGRSEDAVVQEMIRTNPQGRLIRPEEVAETVAWLCGPETDSITGQAIAVAGGEIM